METRVLTPTELLNKIEQKSYWVFRNMHFMGYTRENTLRMTLTGKYLRYPVDEIESEDARVNYKGSIGGATFTLASSDQEFIADRIMKGMFPMTMGTAGPKFGFGDTNLNIDLGIVAEWMFIPKDNAEGDWTGGFRFWKAYPDTEATPIELKGSKTEWQETAVTLKGKPDLNKPPDQHYGEFGNLNAEDIHPLAIGLIMSPYFLQIPVVTLPEFEMDPGSRQVLTAISIYGNETGATAKINDIAGITATATTFPYDTLSVPGGIVPGNLIKIEDELIYVLDVDETDILDCVRGVGTARAAHVDDSDIQVISDPSYYDETQVVDWTSDTPGAATVGDTRGKLDTGQKGLVTHVAPGTAQISVSKTTTTGTATSQATLVTTNA